MIRRSTLAKHVHGDGEYPLPGDQIVLWTEYVLPVAGSLNSHDYSGIVLFPSKTVVLNTSSLSSSWPLIWNFAQRDLRARYKRSALGWAWSMINPLSVVLIYGFVFSVVFRVQPPLTQSGHGQFFSLYLFSGLILWNHFTSLLNGSMAWLASVSDLRKKIYFPTETALLGGAIAIMAQTFLEVAVLVIILVVFSNLSWTIVLLPFVILLAGLFALGLGFVAAILNARYRDISYLVGIILNLGFYATPIIFTKEYLVGKEKWGIEAMTFIEVNPVARYVNAAHDVGYIGVAPSAVDWLIMIVLGVVPFLLGLSYFQSRSMAISEEL